MEETLALNGLNKWMPVGENLKNYCFWNLPKLAQNPVNALKLQNNNKYLLAYMFSILSNYLIKQLTHVI